ncbi:hypothetical protein [Streptomyces sp. NPDC059008]|uniref:hypothetical protein n=1 Tax=Streptomyces sp. NPDC059008 TaxID=3346693 RepID=UPI003677BF68
MGIGAGRPPADGLIVRVVGCDGTGPGRQGGLPRLFGKRPEVAGGVDLPDLVGAGVEGVAAGEDEGRDTVDGAAGAAAGLLAECLRLPFGA